MFSARLDLTEKTVVIGGLIINLLYLHTHDMGRYNGVYGFNINTPAMRSVAEEGVVFRNAHCACPTCSPSRGAMLTGQMPHSNGLMGLAHRGSRINDYSHHLANFMSEKGFRTALIGVQHETEGSPELLGYRYFDAASAKGISSAYERSVLIADTAAGFITSELKEPFFLSVGFGITHRQFPERRIDPDYVQVPACLPDNELVRADYADYVSACEALDKNMQTVLGALKEAGLYDNTLIVLTTDHGIAFPFMKCNLYDSGTGVTLIVKTAKSAPSVKCSDALVSQIDLFPTVCDLMGLEKPDWLQGVSLVPIMNGQTDSVRDQLFTEITFHAAYEPVRAIRTQRYKYIRRFDSEYTKQIMPNIDNGITKQFLMCHGLSERRLAAEELYDLYFDPNERCNLADKPEMQAVREELCGRLEKHMRETKDPLLEGSLIDLPGQLLNDRDSLHPDPKGARESAKRGT